MKDDRILLCICITFIIGFTILFSTAVKKQNTKIKLLETYAEQTDEYINISKELSEKIYIYNEAVTEYNENIEKGNKKQLEVPY